MVKKYLKIDKDELKILKHDRESLQQILKHDRESILFNKNNDGQNKM